MSGSSGSSLRLERDSGQSVSARGLGRSDRNVAQLVAVVLSLLWAGLACLPATTFAQAREADGRHGERLFDAHCSACHQYDGQGMGEAPPLDQSPWVIGPPQRLLLIILHGVTGPIEFEGQTYDREMPGFARSLTDSEIAAVATYARSRFGARSPQVAPTEVARLREQHAGRTQYWVARDLLKMF